MHGLCPMRSNVHFQCSGMGTIQFLQASHQLLLEKSWLSQDSDILLVLMYKLILFLTQAPLFHLSPTPKDDSLQKASCAAFSVESESARRDMGHCSLTLSECPGKLQNSQRLPR